METAEEILLVMKQQHGEVSNENGPNVKSLIVGKWSKPWLYGYLLQKLGFYNILNDIRITTSSRWAGF